MSNKHTSIPSKKVGTKEANTLTGVSVLRGSFYERYKQQMALKGSQKAL